MSRTGLLILIAGVLSLTVSAQLPRECSDKILTPTVNILVPALQDASKLTDAGAKKAAFDLLEQRFTQVLIEGTGLATCLGPAAEAQRLGTVLELRRFDKQVGATSTGGAGSTNLVSSGSVPALLGLALEYGGLTQAFSGTTATFSTTPAKLVAAMAKAYGPDSQPPSDRTLRALERISLAVSFDTSRSDTATAKSTTLLANYQQLSQASVRFLLLNDRDPFAPANWKKIRDQANSSAAIDAANMAREVFSALVKDPSFDHAGENALKAYRALIVGTPTPDAAALTAIYESYFKELTTAVATIGDWKLRVDAYVTARLKADKGMAALYKSISRRPTLTFNYAVNRPPVVSASSSAAAASGGAMAATAAGPPDLSSGTLIFAASLYDSDFTLNATANFFNGTNPTMKGNFRDTQFSAKWDIPVGGFAPLLSKGTLTFSGLYEHLHQAPLGIKLTINDQTINQPGDIGVFQVKYSIPVGDSGVQIPISFTTSNRTELVKEKENRGNIGISFDLDKLFAKK